MGAGVREAAESNIATAQRLHQRGVRLSMQTVDSGRGGDHQARYSSDGPWDKHKPYRPPQRNAEGRATLNRPHEPNKTAASAVNTFFARRYPAGYDELGRGLDLNRTR